MILTAWRTNGKSAGLFLAFFVLSSTSPVSAQKLKESVRQDLNESQLAKGYLLVDPLAKSCAVSVLDRTCKTFERGNAITESLISPNGEYELLPGGGLWLLHRLTDSRNVIDGNGSCFAQCWSPDSKEVVYSSQGIIRVYDVAQRRVVRELGKGDTPHWSPDGKVILFQDKGRFWLISPTGEKKRKLFETPVMHDAIWSPDSRFLSYTRLGGSTGGFLFWGIRCPEPYRVWAYRVEDGAKDWVLNICKPPRTFIWAKNSE